MTHIGPFSTYDRPNGMENFLILFTPWNASFPMVLTKFNPNISSLVLNVSLARVISNSYSLVRNIILQAIANQEKTYF